MSRDYPVATVITHEDQANISVINKNIATDLAMDRYSQKSGFLLYLRTKKITYIPLYEIHSLRSRPAPATNDELFF